MKQEQLVAYSLFLFVVIPLILTTLGGMMILKGAVNFYPYAKFLIGLAISLGLLLFISKNFKDMYGWIYVLGMSVLHSFSLRHSFLFREVSLAVNFMLVLVFFAGIYLCIRHIFLNKMLQSIRTIVFAVVGGAVFTAIFILLLQFAGHAIDGFKEVLQDYSIGFMLFATIGIGFLITDMVLNAIAAHYHLNPDLLTVTPVDEDAEDEDDEDTKKDLDKDDDD